MNFPLLPDHAKEECEAWVKDVVLKILGETKRIGPRTHHFLRETWANGYLAGKQNEEDLLHVQDEEE